LVADRVLGIHLGLLELTAKPGVVLSQRRELFVQPPQVIGERVEETVDLVGVQPAEADCELLSAYLVRTPGSR
jgi:hypothetical protein